MIDINDITLQIDSKVLLQSASLHIPNVWRVGIVGANGCGKTTLFKALTGQTEVVGDIIFSKNCRLSYVKQHIENKELSIKDFVLKEHKELCALRERLKTAPEEELADIHTALKLLNSDSAEATIAQILNGLGFSNDDLSRPVSDFSGGWQMRLALAGALFVPSDILLLDEPTNHLDLEASLWLENRLLKYAGTIILISHDRTFLNTLCDHIVYFNNQKLTLYTGNYDTFYLTHQTQQKVLMRQAQHLEEQRAHLQSFIDRFRYKASKAKQAQSRIKMLEKLEETPTILYEKKDAFSFLEPSQVQPPLISLDDVATGYGDKIVLSKLSLSIGENDRIALLGRNGNGKSTFAKLLNNQLKVFSGSIHKAPKLEIGYFAQHQEEELPLDMTPVEYFSTLMKDKSQTQVRSHLASFGLVQEKALTIIKNLSGGEKARLLFAKISLNAPSLLLLDEPTNHLDISARDALADAINAYKGSVILITHDFHLIENTMDELWLIDKGRCTPFTGDLEDYKTFLLQKETQKQTKEDKEKELKKQEQEQARQVQKQNKAQSRKNRLKLNEIEKQLDKLTQEKEQLQLKFQTKLTGSEIISIQQELNKIEEAITQAEEEWLLLSEEI